MTQSERSGDSNPASTWKYVTIERYNILMKSTSPKNDRLNDELLPDRSSFRKKVERLEPILAMDLQPEVQPVDPFDAE